jgi:hypothetical protein
MNVGEMQRLLSSPLSQGENRDGPTEGKPDAVKAASPVWGGESGNVAMTANHTAKWTLPEPTRPAPTLHALRLGLRGLPGGSSLARLLAAHRGYRNVQGLPGLTESMIESWARTHHQQHGDWPTEYSGAVDGTGGETWKNIDAALREGLRSLPGGDTLPRLLGRRCGARTWSTMPTLTEAGVLAWADAHHEAKGQWPTADSGAVLGQPGETWAAVEAALVGGGRGLEGGSSLARLLAQHRGVRNKAALPPLTEAGILAWARAHHRRRGQWPTVDSGPVEDAPGETWNAVNVALHQGYRGLPGGTSLHLLLVRHCGKVRRRKTRVRDVEGK